LANNEFGIKAISNVEDIATISLVRSDYEKIVELIRNREFEEIRAYQSNGGRTTEYLTITKFTDQNERNFVVTSFDSDELWQDPQVVDIFMDRPR
jgi:hypothetical protein